MGPFSPDPQRGPDVVRRRAARGQRVYREDMMIGARSGRVAVTGASGLLGSERAFRLAAAGAPRRLVVRDAARARRLGDDPLPESDVAVVGGYTDTRGMVEAFTGVDTVVLVS